MAQVWSEINNDLLVCLVHFFLEELESWSYLNIEFSYPGTSKATYNFICET